MTDTCLYKYGRYEVRIKENVKDEFRSERGYGLFNTETGVWEHEDFILRNVLNLARHLEQGVRELLKVKDTPEDDMFEREALDKDSLRPLN